MKKSQIKKKLLTIISKLVDVQGAMPGDIDLQSATRLISKVYEQL